MYVQDRMWNISAELYLPHDKGEVLKTKCTHRDCQTRADTSGMACMTVTVQVYEKKWGYITYQLCTWDVQSDNAFSRFSLKLLASQGTTRGLRPFLNLAFIGICFDNYVDIWRMRPKCVKLGQVSYLGTYTRKMVIQAAWFSCFKLASLQNLWQSWVEIKQHYSDFNHVTTFKVV